MTSILGYQCAGGPGTDPEVPNVAISSAAGTMSAAPRVADLTRRVGCQGRAMVTEPFAVETGRCEVVGAEVIIATFASNDLRDQWVGWHGRYGGHYVAGDGWAATTDSPDAAAEIAAILGGTPA